MNQGRTVATVANVTSTHGGVDSIRANDLVERPDPLYAFIEQGFGGDFSRLGHLPAEVASQTVARIATVAVANPKMLETLVPGEDGGNPFYQLGPGQGSTPNLNPPGQSVAPIPDLSAWVAHGVQALYRNKKEVYSKESLVYPVHSLEFQPEVLIPTGLVEEVGFREVATAIPAIFATVQENRVHSISNPLDISLEPVDLSRPQDGEGDGAIQEQNAEHREIGFATVATVQSQWLASVEALPWKLRESAIELCRNVYRDGEADIALMLEELTLIESEYWPWWVDYFEGRLSISRACQSPNRHVTCKDCSQAAFPDHPMIARCTASIQSGLVTGGFWATDRHHCDRFVLIRE